MNVRPDPRRSVSSAQLPCERTRCRRMRAAQGSGFAWRVTFGGALSLVLMMTGGADPNAQADTQPPVVIVRSPIANATSVSILVDVRVTFNEAVNPASLTLILRDSSAQPVPAAFTYDAPTLYGEAPAR